MTMISSIYQLNMNIHRLNSRKDHRATNSASPGQNVLRFNYKDSSNELHTSIPPMQSIASLEHAKGGPNPNV
ncbi:hypothetical protein EDD18DRAFT_1363284 [Armillaria luteobubalina]|uniref:Uncharacterized protein n=1 Tax=Armillaria luteobubalina TaxID=153913 RepID=A0AA39PC15_9AGAR|nr:hypothetical protein EDD18DRAFT_1363284 [Armillaria luteobubalina]